MSKRILIGVGQQSLLSHVQLTDLVHSLQAGKTVDVSRCASESTDLLPPSALPRLLRSLRLSPPTRPAGCRLPAAAGHRAAVVVLRVHRGRSAYGGGGLQSEGQRVHGGSTDIHSTLLYIKTKWRYPSICAVTPIGRFETFDDSRLTAKMGVSGMRMFYQALIIGHSFAPERSCCGNGGRKADSCGLCTGKPAQKPCWGYYAPRCRQSRHRRAEINGIRYAVSSRSSPSAHCIQFIPQPQGDERPGTYLRGTVLPVRRAIT